MPALVTVTVRPSGHPLGPGDYTSLPAAITGEARDLVNLDEVCRIEVYTYEETARVVVSGFVTGPDHPVEIIAVEGTTGPWIDADRFRITANQATIGYANAALDVVQDYALISGVQVARTHDWWPLVLSFRSVPESGSGNFVGRVRWENCVSFVSQVSSTMDGIGAIFASHPRLNTQWRNCLAVAWEDGGSMSMRGFSSGYSGSDAARNVMLHCGADVTHNGFHVGTDGGSTGAIRNSWDRSGSGLSFNGTLTHQANITAAGSAPSGWTTSTTADIEARYEDYRLTETDTAAVDQGADVSADADWPTAEDMVGTARPQGEGWDIGPWELPDGDPGEGDELTTDPATAAWEASDSEPVPGAVELATVPAGALWAARDSTPQAGAVSLPTDPAAGVWQTQESSPSPAPLTISTAPAAGSWTASGSVPVSAPISLATAPCEAAWTVRDSALGTGIILSTETIAATWGARDSAPSPEPLALATNPATGSWEAQDSTLGIGSVLATDPATATWGARQSTPTPDAASLTTQPATASWQARDSSPDTSTFLATAPATAQWSAVASTPEAGPVTVPTTPAAGTWEANQSSPVPAEAVLSTDPATAAWTAADSTPTESGTTLGTTPARATWSTSSSGLGAGPVSASTVPATGIWRVQSVQPLVHPGRVGLLQTAPPYPSQQVAQPYPSQQVAARPK